MPYIKDMRHRTMLDRIIDNLLKLWVKPGYINYFLFKLAKRTCTNYEQYRNFIGELEACKAEIYRRLAAPYEEQKIQENGDVR
jgi:hypothetical protein